MFRLTWRGHRVRGSPICLCKDEQRKENAFYRKRTYSIREAAEFVDHLYVLCKDEHKLRHAYTHTYTLTHSIHFRTHIHAYVNACTRAYIHVYTHTYFHAFMHTFMHKHIRESYTTNKHTHTHTHTHSSWITLGCSTGGPFPDSSSTRRSSSSVK